MTTVRAFAGGTSPRPSSTSRSPSASAIETSFEADVEEAGPGDLGRSGDRGQVDGAGQLDGEVAGLLADRLGQRHAAVGLVVAELRVGRPAGRPFRTPARSADAPSGRAAPKRALSWSSTFIGRAHPAVRRARPAAALLPVEAGGIAPDVLERVIGAVLGREDVDDEVAVVDEGPAALLGALDAELGLAELLHLLVDLDGDGVALPARGRRDDHEVVDQRGGLAQVEQEDIPGAVVVGDPGAEPGVLQGDGHPVRLAPIGGVMRHLVLEILRLAGCGATACGGCDDGLGGGQARLFVVLCSTIPFILPVRRGPLPWGPPG